MTLLQAIILGIVQGLTEFLPISSSAHLVLLPWFSGWSEHPLSFDCVLHMGSLFAIIIYFRRELRAVWREGILSIKERNIAGTPQRRLFWYIVYIVIATIPACIFGGLFIHQIESSFRDPLLIAVTLALFGILLYIFDKASVCKKTLSGIGLRDTIVIGLAQVIALIPGVSRSGITMTAGLGRGMDRESAARFSFLLAFPVIIGAIAIKAKDIILMGSTGAWPLLLAGFLSAALSGMLAIKCLLNYLKRHGFLIFAVYRVILAVFIIIYLQRL